ncbi:hypothetical protein [Saccharopolyspora dendranthemae]|uniref:Excreted virulence factor EspC (Type VII ESX diderm) n=1 Tax=Saccharopolyspora dendranthemae TaxID=1181886 RepID=A0A561VB43_9PSEU|nr:hypothetical protein [Saccharopolyspora dendranthemae]TWG08824.1 hypothetical protein FHU35_111450 [Saccharopolyspora dendranthemae]
MAGYLVDPAGLESAIKKLEDIRDNARSMVQSIARTGPGAFAGELTAKDNYTSSAFKAINERAIGDQGSLQVIVKDLTTKLTEKIEAYQATLDEYRRNDDAAASSVRHTEQ